MSVPGPPAAPPVLRMVPGMASIFPNTPRNTPARTEVTDWLNGRGGVVFAVIGVLVVAWGAVSQVIG